MSFGVDLNPWDDAGPLDFASDMRIEPKLDELWDDPSAKLLLLDTTAHFDGAHFGVTPSGTRENAAFIGFFEGNPWFVKRTDTPLPNHIRSSTTTKQMTRLASAGLAILNWQDNTRYCTRCAGELRFHKGGYASICKSCGNEEFPRTDPAIIVAVLDHEDRIFLAHHVNWEPGHISTLAGFVEAGESAENAVYREVFEESSLQIESCRFIGSQPWPFPRSLMLAYVARSSSPGQVDGVELEWGGWFSKSDLEEKSASKEISLPGPGTIASYILKAWRAGTLPNPDDPYRIELHTTS